MEEQLLSAMSVHVNESVSIDYAHKHSVCSHLLNRINKSESLKRDKAQRFWTITPGLMLIVFKLRVTQPFDSSDFG